VKPLVRVVASSCCCSMCYVPRTSC